MAKKEDTNEPSQQLIPVKADKIIGSLYAQIVGVVVTDNDLTLEFIYKNPRPEIKEANVVARVTLPRVTAEGLSKTILDTINEHELKKGRK